MWRWHAPQDNGAEITSYKFESRVQGAAWVPANVVDIVPDYSFRNETGLNNSLTYEARVKAINSQGESEWSPVGSASPEAAIPGQVVGVTVSPRDRAAQISFATPDDGGSPILGYHLQWKSGVQAFSSTRQETVTVSPHTRSGLVNGTAYDFRIRAFNAVGNGPWSDTVSAVRPVGASTQLTASNLNFAWPYDAPRCLMVIDGAAGGGGGGTRRDDNVSGGGGGGGGGAGDRVVRLISGLSIGTIFQITIGQGGNGGQGGRNSSEGGFGGQGGSVQSPSLPGGSSGGRGGGGGGDTSVSVLGATYRAGGGSGGGGAQRGAGGDKSANGVTRYGGFSVAQNVRGGSGGGGGAGIVNSVGYSGADSSAGTGGRGGSSGGAENGGNGATSSGGSGGGGGRRVNGGNGGRGGNGRVVLYPQF